MELIYASINQSCSIIILWIGFRIRVRCIFDIIVLTIKELTNLIISQILLTAQWVPGFVSRLLASRTSISTIDRISHALLFRSSIIDDLLWRSLRSIIFVKTFRSLSWLWCNSHLYSFRFHLPTIFSN